MNSRHYKTKSKSQQFERKKVFKGIKKGPPIIWEFVEKEKEPAPMTKWQILKMWFKELPIWSIK